MTLRKHRISTDKIIIYYLNDYIPKRAITPQDDFSKNIIKFKENDKIIFHKRNKGKGAAIKTAIPFINGNIVAIQDADLEYDPKDLNKLVNIMIKNSDFETLLTNKIDGRLNSENVSIAGGQLARGTISITELLK